MRQAFERVRDAGLLEDICGLVYRPDSDEGPPDYLVNTGVQRLVADLDELPLSFESLGLFEPPHRRTGLSRHAVPVDRLGRHADIMSLVPTHGCKFHCPYCPIPAYNQFTFRAQRRPVGGGDDRDCGAHGDPQVLRHGRQFLQQAGDGRGGVFERWRRARCTAGRSARP